MDNSIINSHMWVSSYQKVSQILESKIPFPGWFLNNHRAEELPIADVVFAAIPNLAVTSVWKAQDVLGPASLHLDEKVNLKNELGNTIQIYNIY